MGLASRQLGEPIAVDASSHHAHARHHLHSLDEHVVMPMRTGLRDVDVPLGLRLAGITTGYRQGGTKMDCLWTLFTWHNQTLNSWTMIFGWLVSSWLLWWTAVHLRPRGLDLAAFVAVWLCPTLHLPFTVGYHQFACISPAMLRRWRALDVIFIFVASVPLTFGLAYFVLPLPYTLALTALSVALSLHAWHNAASLPAGAEINKKANTRYVGLVVMVYTFPIALQAALDSRTALLQYTAADSGTAAPYGGPYTLWCALAVAFCFVHGGITYVMNFPDVYAPGFFDLVGAAQQQMHLSIAGAVALEWLFVIHMSQRV